MNYSILLNGEDDRTLPITQPISSVEKVGEGGSLGLLLMLATKGSTDQLATYNVDSESYIQGMRDAQEKLAVIDKLTSVSKETDGKPEELYRTWRKTYEEQRSSQICTVNDKGNTTCTTYTYYVWDEPQQLTKGGLNNQKKLVGTIF